MGIFKDNKDRISISQRRNIFKNELYLLKSHDLISDEDFKKIGRAHETFYGKYEEDVVNTKQSDLISPVLRSKEPVVKQKRVLSPQEIRERNITSILIVGVILVLLSGIILSTSNWGIMSSSQKTLLITLVSGIFFGTSYISDRYLKIQKTAFAFWVLGGLFLPVAVLSAGYFKLFGEYLSIFGQGRYLLGAMGATLCIPVYVYSATKYKNRFFVWLSLIALSADVCFIIASTHVKTDIFYLGLIIYNSLLLFLHHKTNKTEMFSLFKKELPLFTQANLVLTTLFMMIFFGDKTFNGFNLILTSIVYIAMVFSKQGRKEYSFAFTGLLIYGLYQIIESTQLSYFGAIVYALIGFVFLGMNEAVKEDNLKKIFSILSGVISGCSFIYITFQSFLIRETSSWVMLAAYVLIALNFIYLANKTSVRVFSYLAPIFIASAGYQSYGVLKDININFNSSVYMFCFGVIMFMVFYQLNKWRVVQSIKWSSGIVSTAVLFLSIISSLRYQNYLITPIELLAFTVILYLVFKTTQFKEVKQLSKWSIPLTLYLSLLAFYRSIDILIDNSVYNFRLHIWVGIIILFILSMVIRNLEKEIESSMFWIAHILMPLGVILSSYGKFDWPVLFIVPLVIYIYSLKRCLSFREWSIKTFLYMSFAFMTLSLSSLFMYFNLGDRMQPYVVPISSVVVFLIWFKANLIWKKRILLFLVPFIILGVALLNVTIEGTSILGYPAEGNDIPYSIVSVILISMVLYVNQKSGLTLINIVPLWMLLNTLDLINRDILAGFNNQSLIFEMILLTLSLILGYIGRKISNKIYIPSEGIKKIDKLFIDWYTVFGVIFTLVAYQSSLYSTNIILRVFPGLILVYHLYMQISRVESGIAESVVKTVTLISTLLPYYTLIDLIKHPEIVHADLIVLPFVVFCIVLSSRIWAGYRKVMRIVEYIILSGVSLILLQEILLHSRLGDAIILGILSIVSIVFGAHYRRKNFFFSGVITVLLNVLLQTKPFWGRLPWWAYLLIAGLVLIGYASYTEMVKNGRIKKSGFGIKELINKFKEWK